MPFTTHFALVTAALPFALIALNPASHAEENASLGHITVAQADSTTSPRFAAKTDSHPDARRSRRQPAVHWQLGDALPYLDETNAALFAIGTEEFAAVEDIAGGLGPIFNNTSCVACHSSGATGGGSNEKVTRFGRIVDGKFDGYESAGGSLLQVQAVDPTIVETVPADATVVVQRVATPVFGAGLIEAIADETITNNASIRRPDGIRGRTNIVTDITTGEERVGRFGWKAQQATLLAFAAQAYRNEMGVTNRFFPNEEAPNGRDDLLTGFDPVADLEDAIDPATGLGDSDHLANFMRFLAPPPPLQKDASAMRGESFFEQVQCSACHTPVLFTAANPVQALSNQPVRLFSDLLLHDMGELGDGIAQDGAGTHEMRTAPLWGLRFRPSFLHDGRADTPNQAILLHGGEAIGSRALFEGLSDSERADLLEYLGVN